MQSNLPKKSEAGRARHRAKKAVRHYGDQSKPRLKTRGRRR